MQIVIEIPEKMYHMINAGFYDYGDMNVIIQNGTPLPKRHGRLIDADNIIPLALKEKTLVLKDTDLIDIRSREFGIDYLFKDIMNYINDMPTIIEADNGESEDTE